jgi:hypothetical protein
LRLARIRRYGSVAAISTMALQAGDPVEYRSRELHANNQRIGVTLDAIYTAEDIGSYKLDPRNLPI